MAYNFLPCDRNQAYLLPPSLTDWLPEDHLAWFVLDAVEQIDLSQFYKKYRTDDLRDRNSRISRLKACKERLEQEKTHAQKAQQDKIDKRKAKEENTGKKSRGRKPKSPEEAENKDAKANVTDPDSRIMKTRKGYVQGLNGQTVTTEEQIIVAEDVTQEENDKQQLHPMLEQTEANRQEVGIKEKTGVALADAGYCSEENFTKTPAGNVELLVAVQKDYKQRKAMAEQPPPEEPIPDGLSPTELMERKLLTERGRELYKIRGRTVEPVFGQIKDARGFDKFMRRGFEACRSEWSLICATHNLLKLWRSGKACWN